MLSNVYVSYAYPQGIHLYVHNQIYVLKMKLYLANGFSARVHRNMK